LTSPAISDVDARPPRRRGRTCAFPCRRHSEPSLATTIGYGQHSWRYRTGSAGRVRYAWGRGRPRVPPLRRGDILFVGVHLPSGSCRWVAIRTNFRVTPCHRSPVLIECTYRQAFRPVGSDKQTHLNGLDGFVARTIPARLGRRVPLNLWRQMPRGGKEKR
jgi:hypothetical protein